MSANWTWAHFYHTLALFLVFDTVCTLGDFVRERIASRKPAAALRGEDGAKPVERVVGESADSLVENRGGHKDGQTAHPFPRPAKPTWEFHGVKRLAPHLGDDDCEDLVVAFVALHVQKPQPDKFHHLGRWHLLNGVVMDDGVVPYAGKYFECLSVHEDSIAQREESR